ncbi:hypothetical protein M011DRAFT_69399 [Sporormia fimetaria CBS 119925]|uniref:Uncharacterized protein n=1 Tax=Sporormia fimetaria CBS 119925 TaxID=1340428 RepID=A0A6A6V9W2_9PLEO|nr:hypothetical protein M011DRAFT_69399 [Sporormia fimetaria CBS 119925]
MIAEDCEAVLETTIDDTDGHDSHLRSKKALRSLRPTDTLFGFIIMAEAEVDRISMKSFIYGVEDHWSILTTRFTKSC